MFLHSCRLYLNQLSAVPLEKESPSLVKPEDSLFGQTRKILFSVISILFVAGSAGTSASRRLFFRLVGSATGGRSLGRLVTGATGRTTSYGLLLRLVTSPTS